MGMGGKKVDITLRVMVQDEQETRCNFKGFLGVL